MSIPLYVLDRIEGFNLVCSGFQVPSRTVHPVGSCILLNNFPLQAK